MNYKIKNDIINQIYNRGFYENRSCCGEIFVIRPENPLDIGRVEHDVNKVRRAYDIGAKNAEEKIEELKEWLEK